MAKANEHGRIIAAAAKAALAPIGCVRKGQSRVWYSDKRYWLIGVEFQPSGWAKGTYLNMHVAWLWHPARGYQITYRPVFFTPFENIRQFTPLVVEMANIAAIEVQKLRDRFNSFSDILRHLISHATRDSWPIFDAAVASGLAGDFAGACRYFDRMAAWTTHGYDWEIQLKADCAELAALLDRPDKFREAILGKIEKRRQLMRLPPDAHCLDELDSKAGP
ncbi:MAG: hypothetical protein GC182_16070 [Rhodopseudomonas sp.]|nr:hypothetical protein [Rhodopseudomonas sp.]